MFTTKIAHGKHWIVSPGGTLLRAFDTAGAARAAAARANAGAVRGAAARANAGAVRVGRTDPRTMHRAKMDSAQEERQLLAERLELLILVPLAFAAVTVMGYAIGMLFSW